MVFRCPQADVFLFFCILLFFDPCKDFFMSHKDFSLRQKKEKHDIKKAKTCIPVFEDNFVHLIFAAVKSVAMDYAKRSTRTTPRCLECGKSLGYGRSDRKYCSDGCRNSHHNHLARSGRNIRRRVMTILERNYQILDAVVKSGVQAVWLSDLMAAGFNPGYLED